MLFLFLSSDLTFFPHSIMVSEAERRNLSLILPGRRLLPSLELDDSLLKVVFSCWSVPASRELELVRKVPSADMFSSDYKYLLTCPPVQTRDLSPRY